MAAVLACVLVSVGLDKPGKIIALFKCCLNIILNLLFLLAKLLIADLLSCLRMEVIKMDNNDRRMNLIIDLVNANRLKSELVPPIQNEEEDELFDRLARDLEELRRKNPKAEFAHIDSEWGFYDCGYDMD